MISGVFKSFTHQHYFSEDQGITAMYDVFTFRAPWGILGRIAEVLFLRRCMQAFLMQRNVILKQLGSLHLKQIFDKFTGHAGLAFGHLFRCAVGNDFPAAGTAFGAEVDEVISAF